MRRALVFLCAAATLSAQSSSVPYAEQIGQLFSVKSTGVSDSSPARAIRDVDFRNMWVYKPGGIRLKSGRYDHEDRQQTFFETVELLDVYYLAQPFALAVYHKIEGGGSSTSSGIAEVFRLGGGKLQLTQAITWDADAERDQKAAGIYAFDAATKTLVIRASHYLPSDAHCCISAVDVVSFRWKQDHFEQSAMVTELSAYGREKDRTLVHQ